MRKIFAFRVVEDLRDRLSLRIESGRRDFIARRDELAQNGALANDLGVPTQVGCARHALRQRIEVREPAAFVSLAETLQVLEHRDHVGRPRRVDERSDGRIDEPMLVP